MRFMGVNLWAVLVSALATMVVGFVWYSPLLFARRWTILMGYDPDDKAKLAEMQKSAGPSYMLSLVASVLSATVPGKSSPSPASTRRCMESRWVSQCGWDS